MRELFATCDNLLSRGYKTCQGLITADDFRFLRLWWEFSGKHVRTAQGIRHPDRWAFFAKGGEFAPFYSTVYMIVDCQDGFRSLIDNANEKYPYLKGGAAKMLHAVPGLFFQCGLNYTRRTTSEFSVRALPAGLVFSDKGPAIVSASTDHEELLVLLGVLNTRAFRGLLSLSLGAADAAARSYETGIVERVPLPVLSSSSRKRIAKLARSGWQLQRLASTWDETSPEFEFPAVLQGNSEEFVGILLVELAERSRRSLMDAAAGIAAIQSEIDDLVWDAYGLELGSQTGLMTALTLPSEDNSNEADEEKQGIGGGPDAPWFASAVIHFSVGIILGRWDARRLLNRALADDAKEPFTRLADFSEATLLADNDLPATTCPTNYPLQMDSDGIIVDDAEHSDDIVHRIREVLELIWKDRAEAIEKEACEILGVRELRDYFRRPGNGGFWDDHVARYSKSRRKAPIYWQLQSSKKSYALWLYYHRLDKDTLFKARQNYVDPKIRLVESQLSTVRNQVQKAKDEGQPAKERRKVEKELEKQEALLSELTDFAEKLERAAKLNFGHPAKLNSEVVYDPDLNDGVVLTIAPLHELVPWKEAKKYWEELLEGKYEWSSMGKLLRKKGLVE